MSTIPAGYSLFADDLRHIDHQLESDWESLRGAHLFITGGTGFFGMWLLESLLWANARRGLGLHLSVLSRDPARFLAGRARHLKGRGELALIEGGLLNFRPPAFPVTHIIHAASETDPDHSANWPSRHLDAVIDGTRRLLDLAAEHRVNAVLLTSSGAAYGQNDRAERGRWI
ncbi:MAG: NAD(P)-dependent oxidoreductase, partial [Clostridia bacterium]|nr:NAD(P)-dependent oxidoreductase [Clostridia bacterium]